MIKNQTMKKFITTSLFIGILSQIILAQNTGDFINSSSVDKFFEISKVIASGKEPSENEWEALFETAGYKIRAHRDIIRNMAIFAFHPGYEQQRDSILKFSIVDDMSDDSKTSSKLTLINFLDMKNNLNALEEFRNTYDFNSLKERSEKRLKSFLKNTVDSLIVFPSINLLCQEADAQSKPKGIVIDFNLFYKQVPNDENINFLAHEMFHSYRRHFENKELVKSNNLMRQIDNLQNEGTADLIDKTLNSLTQKLINWGYPQSFVDFYISTYENTPDKLQVMDSITCSFIHKEINEEEFNKQLKDFFILGGHPNGYYMTNTIKEAGLIDELIARFDSPVDFIKIYNQAAREKNTYVLSNEFISYLEQLELKYAD
jgi:hypothetical protein